MTERKICLACIRENESKFVVYIYSPIQLRLNVFVFKISIMKRNSRKGFYFFKVLFYFYTVIILFLSLKPSYSKEKEKKLELLFSIRMDYLKHFLAYAVFMLLFFLAFHPSIRKNSFFSFFLVFSAGLGFGVLIELLQIFVPGRAFNRVDIYYNSSGLLAGILIFLFLHRFFREKIKNSLF
jgi:VanZ family protein